MRLRVFDLNTRWFKVYCLFQRGYGEPWLQMVVTRPLSWMPWSVYVWRWEPVPDMRGGYEAASPASVRDAEEA